MGSFLAKYTNLVPWIRFCRVPAINFNRVFHEINHPCWGTPYPYFWKHPYEVLMDDGSGKLFRPNNLEPFLERTLDDREEDQ